MLTNTESQLWSNYLEAESRATRERKLNALEVFVDQLTSRPLQDWQPWAFRLVASVVDENIGLNTKLDLVNHCPREFQK